MKYRYFSVFLLLLILSVGAVSAQDSTVSDSNIGIVQDDDVLSASEFIIDDSNYNTYFDESGVILENSNISDGDSLKLGDINDKNFVIDKNLTITSNASSDILKNVSFNIIGGSDGSVISNLNIQSANTAITIYNASNIQILENNINIVDAENSEDLYAIYADLADKLNVNANVITYVGKTNGTAINNAICVLNSKDVSFELNEFTITIPSVDVDWKEIPPASGNYVRFPVSEGIVFKNITDLLFSENTVSLTGSNITTLYGFDTIYVIDVDSDNAIISSNIINANGRDYVYGLIISGNDFTVEGNEFDINADNYANGIDVEGPATGIVSDNEIEVTSPVSAYGIYAAMSNGNVSVDYINNVISGNSYALFGFEVGGNKAYINKNTLYLAGNYTTGIAIRVNDEATITYNEIVLDASNEGNMYVWDGFGVVTSGVHALLGDITVKYNAITSTGEYTVNTTANGSVTDNYLIANTLSGDDSVKTNNTVLVENNIPVVNETEYNLTNDTFFLFFDNDGILRDGITADKLTFIGEFSNVADNIFINKPITLLSDNVVLNDICIEINSNDVVVDGFTFISDKLSEAISISNSNNVSIVNNKFNFTGLADDNNCVISIDDSSNVEIKGNTIDFIVATNETFQNAVIISKNSDNVSILENEINANIPSRSINWTTGVVYSEGICLDNCDNAVLSNNNVTVQSNDKLSNYDTVYAVHVTGDNAVISENNINVIDAPYGYGIVIAGDNFAIENNVIEAGENETYACGIDVESNSKGVIDSNGIIVTGISAYGIYTANWAGDVKVNITNNTLTINGNSAFAMSLTGSEANVENNTIIMEGNYTTGIASKVDNITISDNKISDNASNTGDKLGYDSMGIETTGIHIVSGNAIVTNNNITTTGDYTVDAKGTGQITDNYLIANEYTGDASVDFIANNTVTNNTPTMYKVNLIGNDLVIYYKNGTRYIVRLTDAGGNVLANQSVVITINNVSYTRVTNANGAASIPLNLNSGNYTVTSVYVGTGYYANASIENNITILSTVFGEDLVKVYRNASQYIATFYDKQGNPLANTTVRFNINGVMYERKTNANGTARLNIWLEQGEYVITAINPVNGEMHANNVTVLASITNTSDLQLYYCNGSQYKVTIIGADGKPVGAGVNVTFNINGVFYTRKTNAEGIARLNIKLQPGNYTITAEYDGCRVSNNIEVLPILYAEDLVKKYGTSDQFRALLLDGQGKPYSGQKVTFNINGLYYERTTNEDGYASLNIKVGATVDEYLITSSYGGTSISNKIIVYE